MGLPSIKNIRKAAYPTIDPKRPENSQAGRTVLITGGHSGIGYAISKAFIVANAKRIIIFGRRADVLESAGEKLTAEAKELGSPTVVDTRSGDIANPASVKKLFSGLKADGIILDVLVLNAATGGTSKKMVDMPLDEFWGDYHINVRSTFDLIQQFYHQESEGPKYVVNLSTLIAYVWHLSGKPSYGLTKNASLGIAQQFAQEHTAEELQIISFHPGAVLTPMSRADGFDESSPINWDNAKVQLLTRREENLPAALSVWAATPAAAFLHGRFIWSNWDVDELRSGEAAKLIDSDPNYLRIGISGLTEKDAVATLMKKP
ncbi:short chain dehydrogenase domain-containing protein [Trichoderma breve]|uniref:Short chain dehydrogenase domain-containing protein n=1 Tax=Trichoderma breve TaxID=2034170 RepID=A0A9W9E472_9HYPO|nr:short chain dehydrogenase domain-containing protein [Trichoderma breve]KAJ4856685.1 short chain dehydrogenase domain-containing protein [Trichoderma breve]